MPRQTAATYLDRRIRLQRLWGKNFIVFRLLGATEQGDLHRYFNFATEIPPAFFISHLHRVTAQDPSLPHRAGRAYAKLERRIAQIDWTTYGTVAGQPKVRVRATGKNRRVTVTSIIRPTIDTERIAKALVAMVIREAERVTEETDNE